MNQKAYNYRPMQLNRQILQSPVVLFLGAGASQSLDKLTMKPFVERLPARIKYRPDPVKKALQHLIEHCGDDLENILGELDAIIHLKSATSVSMIREGGSRSISQDVANSVRHAIEYDIIREYAEVPLEKVTRLYRPLFDLIFARIDPQVHCLPIFTTNYDPAIETFCDAHANEYALTDGFKHMHRDYVWDPETFHGFHFTPGKRSIVLFKLHGSVDWLLLRLKNAIIRSQPFHQSIDTKRYQKRSDIPGGP